MKNKITFFRLSNSYSVEDELNLRNKTWVKEFKHLSEARGRIDEFEKKEYQELTNEQSEIYRIIENTIEGVLFKIDKDDSTSKKDYKIINNHLEKPKLKNLNLEIIRNIYSQINKDTNIEIEKIFEIQMQGNYNHYYKIKEDLKLQNKENENERVQFEDLEEINLITEKMNKDGWKIKQIEGIQSGKFSFVNNHKGGLGYSYTEGIMIVWEK